MIGGIIYKNYLPIWSIVIGVLATAVAVSLSVKSDSGLRGSQMQKRKKQSREKNSKKLFVRWKGVNKMTVVFAAFMVSNGILGRDSMVCG